MTPRPAKTPDTARWSLRALPLLLVVCSAVPANLPAAETPVVPARAATVVVATADSSPASRQQADFLADGTADQEEINAAVRALPPAGGTVLLCEGTYDIRRVEGALGGVLIQRSHVTLAGQGGSTRLVLADGQNINVIRVLGAGVGHVVIRDLEVDANRQNNDAGRAEPDLEYRHFEFCGIKAYSSDPRANNVEFAHDITVRNCIVRNAKQLGVMLEGRNMRCLDNLLGNCGSDCVELLGGPGIIRGNTVEVTERVHVAVGSDRASGILMQGNVVQVKAGGFLDIGFRSWAGTDRHVISGNILHVEEGGRCTLAMDIRGRGAVAASNNVSTATPEQSTEIRITAAHILFSGNLLQNVVIRVNDETDENLPVVIGHNPGRNIRLIHDAGRLVRLPSADLAE